ncbi:hypothetical protein QN382_05210 [Pseudomonas sp. 10B1]|uniref:hypothetical protein n=1 Tax=unclassified Pseudomonas TaxID=196821 RepID=UPI002AB3A7A9|nr:MULTISPECIES: hypothetical protein [unclassified Pseudomonas]MDY7563158.1 hypothetical protein [Pseudomonas sp. AB6]MEA9979399.1 hypothetical protein [Pseudomonas sp. RTS4]MEA9993759.1 hypothetical protein [Pseudomonas sp. AA4]MEB0085100.1 hypothetical protein [Pseudomonas sp. RTI1]MEB0125203.1 hypothetical protein [Pseudomonas sp. CCC1.2]
MKHPLLLSLTLSLIASCAFAMPVSEQAVSAQAKPVLAATFNTLAEGDSDHANKQSGRIADTGTGRLIQQYQRVAEGGSDRLLEQHRRQS